MAALTLRLPEPGARAESAELWEEMRRAMDQNTAQAKTIRPSRAGKLAAIEPGAFVASVDRVLVARAASIARTIGAELVLSDTAQRARHQRLWAIAIWAKTGDHEMGRQAKAYFHEVVELITSAGAGASMGLSTGSTVGLTLVAARGRWRLAAQEPLDVPDVAALTEYTETAIGLLRARGMLRAVTKPRAGYVAPIRWQSASDFLREEQERCSRPASKRSR